MGWESLSQLYRLAPSGRPTGCALGAPAVSGGAVPSNYHGPGLRCVSLPVCWENIQFCFPTGLGGGSLGKSSHCPLPSEGPPRQPHHSSFVGGLGLLGLGQLSPCTQDSSDFIDFPCPAASHTAPHSASKSILKQTSPSRLGRRYGCCLFTRVHAPKAWPRGQRLPLGSGHRCRRLGTSSEALRTEVGLLYPGHLRACLFTSGDSRGSEAGRGLQKSRTQHREVKNHLD